MLAQCKVIRRDISRVDRTEPALCVMLFYVKYMDHMYLVLGTSVSHMLADILESGMQSYKNAA